VLINVEYCFVARVGHEAGLSGRGIPVAQKRTDRPQSGPVVLPSPLFGKLDLAAPDNLYLKENN
jgi:hypothetical protein